MFMKENSRATKMHEGEGVISYLSRNHSVIYEIETIEEKLVDNDIVKISLNGFTKE